MKRYSTVEAAVELVVKNLEANRKVYDTDSIRAKVYAWYENTDVTDSEILAACVLEGKDWSVKTSYQEMLDLKEWWFPHISCNDIAIWEIEEAQRDAFWC